MTVRSIVGRFLEHSRVYRFENAGRHEIYLGSADWTARNFFRRVETSWPVQDPSLRDRVESILEVYWRDKVKTREQNGYAPYVRGPTEGPHPHAHALFFLQIHSLSQ